MSLPDERSARGEAEKNPRGPDPIETMSAGERVFERWRRTVTLFLGPLSFAALLVLPPDGLPPEAARLLAVLAWVIVWWMGEAVPLAVTAVLGPALATVLGVGKATELFAPFGDPIIFLFLGSFILAEAMLATGLDRRFALTVLARPWVGASPSRIMLAFIAIAGGLSMWLSNTATTAMLYPIALAVLVSLSRLRSLGDDARDERAEGRFATVLMLAVAWAASIGGLATPVGTPPNLIVLGQLSKLADVRISFFQFMVLAAPATVVSMLFLVLLLRRAIPPGLTRVEGARELIVSERAQLGALTRGERNVLVAFALTVALWLLPGLVALGAGAASPAAIRAQAALPEGVVAVFGAALLFVLPVDWKNRRFTLAWSRAMQIDWGTLLLFGGGLSLGSAMFRTGLAAALGEGLVRHTGATSGVALAFLFCAVAVVMSETTSNTASATMVAPLAIAAAQAAGVSPVAPALAACFGASMGFMLPVSTPPNAIVYGSGLVPITSMLRNGIVLDAIGCAIIPPAVLLTCSLLGL
ncbi:MAG: SLC13 family permease [Acidobacteriota bacterium]